jgi:histidinol-phosphate/aromatic aminotransferase/cobyric acid decarboxylase-like protein
MLIVDESFIDFMDDWREATVADELDAYHNLAVVKSLSKCYGIGGLRLGYLLTANGAFAEAVRHEIPIWNVNGLAEAFLRIAPRYRAEFRRSCDLVRADRDDLFRRLSSIGGLRVYRPDANFVLCRLPDQAASGPEVTRQLFVESNILVKHCAEKAMPEADRYLRIASRTREENRTLAGALQKVLSRRMSGVPFPVV